MLQLIATTGLSGQYPYKEILKERYRGNLVNMVSPLQPTQYFPAMFSIIEKPSKSCELDWGSGNLSVQAPGLEMCSITRLAVQAHTGRHFLSIILQSDCGEHYLQMYPSKSLSQLKAIFLLHYLRVAVKLHLRLKNRLQQL